MLLVYLKRYLIACSLIKVESRTYSVRNRRNFFALFRRTEASESHSQVEELLPSHATRVLIKEFSTRAFTNLGPASLTFSENLIDDYMNFSIYKPHSELTL